MLLSPLSHASAGQPSDALATIVRIQGDLERLAAGRPRQIFEKRDPLEEIVEAYADFLAGNDAAMDEKLAEIGTTAASRVAVRSVRPATIGRPQDVQAYLADLAASASNGSSLTRLLAGLRRVDGVLFLEATNWWVSALGERALYGMQTEMPISQTWLRLPCRTVIGRASAFSIAADALGKLAGPLLSCPVDTDSFEAMAALANDPAKLTPHAARLSKPPLTDIVPDMQGTPLDRAIEGMADDPETADPVLAAAAAQRNGAAKLDYALFLHAFRPQSPARDARIAALLIEIDDLPPGNDFDNDHGTQYEGSDASLVDTIEAASSSGRAQSESAYYAIPCPILLARPALLEATKPRYGGNRDNFIPRSGCAWGRGGVTGFPAQTIEAFIQMSHLADGDYINNFDGTLRFTYAGLVTYDQQRMMLDPKSFLQDPAPALDFPYQLWGYGSLANRRISLQLKSAYDSAVAEISRYNEHLGLTPDQAAQAAKTALFTVVLGADCGKTRPTLSLRSLLIEGAEPMAIKAWLDQHGEAETAEVTKCMDTAAFDPPLLLAAGNPAALGVLLNLGHKVDEHDDLGKTALMVAAQFDEFDSVHTLVAARANVDATTWAYGDDGTLAGGLHYDGRTALMYAAANASLPVITALLQAGADPYRADTKGRRAIDYLLGFGPTPPNSRLTVEERIEAARLLF